MSRLLMPRLMPRLLTSIMVLLLAVWVLRRPLHSRWPSSPAAQLEAFQMWALVARRSSVVARRIVCCRRDDGVGLSTDCTTALTAHSPEQMPELHPALRAAA